MVDLTVYNQRRLTDPSLPPVPVSTMVIADEYQELLSDRDWGDKFFSLFWRIMRQGRAYHMFLQLVGQTVDTQKLRDIRKLLGFIIGRTGTRIPARPSVWGSPPRSTRRCGGSCVPAGGAATATPVPILLLLG